MATHSILRDTLRPLQPAISLANDWPATLSDLRPQLLEETSEPPRVLLVAELETERRMMASMLRREGCRIVEAGDGQTALEHLGSQRFDLVILDRDMTQMDGLECCHRIKSERKTSLT